MLLDYYVLTDTGNFVWQIFGDFMACLNPNYVKTSIDPDTGSLHTVFLGNAKFTNPLDFGTPYVDSVWYTTVPCGKCSGCHVDYSREWSNRMVLELQDSSDAIFVTLTYNNDNLSFSKSGYPTLVKRDIQLFFKRLRKYFPDRRIRYYVAGEYGPKTHRPHYHAIIYGLSLSDFDDIKFRNVNEVGSPFYSSDTFTNIWSKGFTLLSDVNYRTCNYVSRYVLKKQGSIDDHPFDVVKPFNLSSRNPGLGMDYALDLLNSGDQYFSLDTKDGVRQISIPKSIIKRFKETNFCNLSEICYNRSTIARERMVLDLTYSQLPFSDFLNKKKYDLSHQLNLLPERM